VHLTPVLPHPFFSPSATTPLHTSLSLQLSRQQDSPYLGPGITFSWDSIAFKLALIVNDSFSRTSDFEAGLPFGRAGGGAVASTAVALSVGGGSLFAEEVPDSPIQQEDNMAVDEQRGQSGEKRLKASTSAGRRTCASASCPESATASATASAPASHLVIQPVVQPAPRPLQVPCVSPFNHFSFDRSHCFPGLRFPV
jgi:hypothetical protein